MLLDEALVDQVPFKATLPMLACFCFCFIVFFGVCLFVFVRGSSWRSQGFKSNMVTKGNEKLQVLIMGKQSSRAMLYHCTCGQNCISSKLSISPDNTPELCCTLPMHMEWALLVCRCQVTPSLSTSHSVPTATGLSTPLGGVVSATGD